MYLYKNIKTLLACVLLSALLSNIVHACEKEWASINNEERGLTVTQKIEAWKAQENNCTDKTTFVKRIVSLYIIKGDSKAAKQFLERKKALLHSNIKMYDLLKVDILMQEKAEQKEVSATDWNEIIKGYADIIEQYPQWHAGYQALGGIYIGLGDYQRAIDFSMNALAYGETSYIYRNLTIANSQLKHANLSLTYFDKAYRLDNNLFKDQIFMFAGYYSYLEVGKLDNAKRVIKLIARYHPELQGSTKISDAIAAFRNAAQSPTQ